MRTLFSKSSILFSAALVSMLAMGCTSDKSTSQEAELGTVGMAIALPDSAGDVSSVSWTITGNGVNRSASIDVSRSRTASAQIGGLAAGTGYLLTMSGVSTNGNATCAGSASFDIIAGHVTRLSLNMTCQIQGGNVSGTNTRGSVSVTAGTTVQTIDGDVCPVIDSIEATPGEVMVGSTIALAASGTDTSPLTYSFATAGGTGSASIVQSGAGAQLTCLSAGTVVISVTVSDGVAACNVTNSETIVVCSLPYDGVGGATSVGTTAIGGSTSVDTTAVGGSTSVDTTAVGGTTATGGTTSVDTTAVGGTTATGGTTSTTTTPPVRNIQSVILNSRGLDCYACALTNCASEESSAGMDLITSNPGSRSCDVLAGNAVAGPAAGTALNTLCLDNLQCIMETRCTSLNSAQSCFCGTASGLACLTPGSANGACLATEQAGLESLDPTRAATNFGDPSLAAGSSNTLVQCMIDNGCSTCL